MRQARKRTISKVHVDGNKFSPQEDTRTQQTHIVLKTFLIGFIKVGGQPIRKNMLLKRRRQP